VRRFAWIAASSLAMVGCASLHSDPPRVTVDGIEPAADQSADHRMQLKLRIQNPNNAPIDYAGVYVELIVQGKTFASGVTNQSGTVPGFSEQLVTVPITISVMGVIGQVMSLLGGKSSEPGSNSLDNITYEMRGKLGTTPFKSQGQLSLPGTSLPPGESAQVPGDSTS
jgi:Late embryogenesis abundant protein